MWILLKKLWRARMSKRSFDAVDVATFHLVIAHALMGKTLTYEELSNVIGGIARGHGPRLTRMGEWCRDNGLPLLSVIVVSKVSGFPSTDAAFYAESGIHTEEETKAEIDRCFAHDWSSVDLPKLEPS